MVPVHGSNATALNFSDQNLGPGELIVISSAISVIPALSLVNLSQNKCFGSKGNGCSRGSDYYKELHDTDKDQTGCTAFCEVLPSTKFQTLVLSDIGIGPVGLTTLAKFIPDSPALTEVNLSVNPMIGSVTGFKDKRDGSIIPAVEVKKGLIATEDLSLIHI